MLHLVRGLQQSGNGTPPGETRFLRGGHPKRCRQNFSGSISLQGTILHRPLAKPRPRSEPQPSLRGDRQPFRVPPKGGNARNGVSPERPALWISPNTAGQQRSADVPATAFWAYSALGRNTGASVRFLHVVREKAIAPCRRARCSLPADSGKGAARLPHSGRPGSRSCCGHRAGSLSAAGRHGRARSRCAP